MKKYAVTIKELFYIEANSVFDIITIIETLKKNPPIINTCIQNSKIELDPKSIKIICIDSLSNKKE